MAERDLRATIFLLLLKWLLCPIIFHVNLLNKYQDLHLNENLVL
jgi:hypothetical protein